MKDNFHDFWDLGKNIYSDIDNTVNGFNHFVKNDKIVTLAVGMESCIVIFNKVTTPWKLILSKKEHIKLNKLEA